MTFAHSYITVIIPRLLDNPDHGLVFTSQYRWPSPPVVIVAGPDELLHVDPGPAPVFALVVRVRLTV